MKVCVFGAGAIGSHLAARMDRGGAKVSVVARGANLLALKQNGLRVVTPTEELFFRRSEGPHAASRSTEHCAFAGKRYCSGISHEWHSMVVQLPWRVRQCGRPRASEFASGISDRVEHHRSATRFWRRDLQRLLGYRTGCGASTE